MESKQNDRDAEPLLASEEYQFPAPDTALPTVLLVGGMAGTGKSTLIGSLCHTLQERRQKRCYVINLDPAALHFPYKAHVDIRATVKYRKVMKKYNLGPNGAILTALNLYATKFEQLLAILKQREREFDFVLVDTPGQIEVLNWSASGAIILSLLASQYPTVALYTMDSSRCAKPVVFVSNLLFSTALNCRLFVPVVNVLTKADLGDAAELLALVADPLAFVAKADQAEHEGFAVSLSKSVALHLGRFYQDAPFVAVSVDAETAELRNVDAFLARVADARAAYFAEYLPKLRATRDAQRAQRGAAVAQNLARFDEDCAAAARSDQE